MWVCWNQRIYSPNKHVHWNHIRTPPPNFEAIQHLVIDQYQGEQKPELMLVPQESRQEMWLPLTCFDISPQGKNGCFLTDFCILSLVGGACVVSGYLGSPPPLLPLLCASKSSRRTRSFRRTSKSSKLDIDPVQRQSRWNSHTWMELGKSKVSAWDSMMGSWKPWLWYPWWHFATSWKHD